MENLALHPGGWLSPTLTTFGLIALAEMGDKTQLVCMTLAARHRAMPVFLGASLAFVFLNILAVVFGAGLAQVIPERVLAGVVAVLFGVFGILSLRSGSDEEGEEEMAEKGGGNIFFTAFIMLFLAELGDKTQIAVAGMASTAPAIPVWIGATIALITTSALGVVAGRKLLTKMNPAILHRVSGIFFLALAGFAAYKAIA